MKGLIKANTALLFAENKQHAVTSKKSFLKKRN